LKQVRQHLVGSFERWGMPETVKVDNGWPFGDPQRKVIPVLALWLIGHGISVVWNRPRQPTDNAKVERMQQTTRRWVDLARCSTVALLRDRLTEVAQVQREQYPVSRLGFRSRASVYPGLHACEPRYAGSAFDIKRVYSYLSACRLVRIVASNGQASLYGHGYQIGKQYRGETIGVGFDADEVAWVFYDRRGAELRRHRARQLGAGDVLALSVSQRTDRRSQAP
jgi:hypothetical protein